MTIILIILASAYTAIHDASKWAFIVLYAATFFFANFGPNATTFITPVEVTSAALLPSCPTLFVGRACVPDVAGPLLHLWAQPEGCRQTLLSAFAICTLPLLRSRHQSTRPLE